MVTAPIGYGKTALMSEWYAYLKADGNRSYETAWLTLDAQDSDENRMWRHVFTSLNIAFPHALDDCRSSDGPFSPEDRFVRISNRLYEFTSGSDRKHVVFIDNMDVVSPMQQERLLRFMFDYLPSSTCVVVSGSALSPAVVDFHYLDMVYEFPLHDLAFDCEESRELVLSIVGKNAQETTVKTLCDLAQGWVTGLRLLARTLVHPISDTDSEPLASIGEDLLIDNFFTTFIAQEESETLMPFLVETSICDDVCADLCDYITMQADSQKMLGAISARRLFMTAYEDRRGWYHYHPLFLLWLRSKLVRQGSSFVRERAYRASEWFERHGTRGEAAKYMLLASDTEFIENLTAAAGFSRENRQESFLSWACNLDSRRIGQEILPSLFVTWAYYLGGDAVKVRFWLDVFKMATKATPERDVGEGPRGRLAAASHMAELIRIKCNQYEGQYEDTLAELTSFMQEHGDMNLAMQCLSYHALAESCDRVGDFDGAYANYLRSEAIAETANSTFYKTFSRYSLGWIQAFRGDLKLARETCLRALDDCPCDYTLYGALHSLLAYVQIERHELEEAKDNVEFACDRLSSTRNTDMLLEAQAVRAHLLATSGNIDEAYRVIVMAVAPFEGTNVPRGVLLFSYAIRARVALMRNEMNDAAATLVKLTATMGENDVLYKLTSRIVEANILNMQNDGPHALSLLQDVSNQARACGLGLVRLEALLAQAVIQHELNDKCKAYALVYEALRIGAPQQAISVFLDGRGIFLDGRETVVSMLHEIASVRQSGSAERAFAKAILARFSQTESAQTGATTVSLAQAHLTRRELEVLDLLNEGMSRQEMANMLGISVNTIKTHVNNIYAKLGVENHTDAFTASLYLD